MRIAVVDDSPGMREQLSDYISRYGRENGFFPETDLFPDGDSLLSDFQSIYDIIIFDIDMPGTNGMDTARQVRKKDKNVVILFVTNIARYAINGYEVEAVDYVLKPISYGDFSLKFRRALRKVKKKEEACLILDTSEGRVQVKAGDIRYVEVLNHYLLYHTSGRVFQVRGSFREHESVLRRYHFSRCHRSYMVNLSHIRNIRASGVVLDGEVLPLGRTCKETLMKDYLDFLHG